MGDSPAFQFYPSDWVMGTLTFSVAEDGAYLRCILHQWNTGAVPGDDIAALARVMRVSVVDARKLWAVVREKFDRGDDGLWRNVRLEAERQKQAEFRLAKAESGRRGGLAKAKRNASTATDSLVANVVAKQVANPSSSSSSSVPPPSKNEGGGRAPALAPLTTNQAKNWGLRHSDHVAGFCTWMCLPVEDFGRFSARLGGDDKALAWAQSIKASGIVPTGKPWEFWNAQFDAAHGSAVPRAGGFSKADWDAHMPGGAIDRKLGVS